MSSVTREPELLDADVIPSSSEVEEEAFTPVILRNVETPNLKIMRSIKQRIAEGPRAGMWRVTQLEPYTFVNSYFRADTRDKYETVMRVCKGHIFIEPTDDETTFPPQQYFDDKGRELLRTRNPELFQAFVRKMNS